MIDYDKIRPLRRPLREILESAKLLRNALYWYRRDRDAVDDEEEKLK